MIIVDSHVHIYKCFDIDKFFDFSMENFNNYVTNFQFKGDYFGVLCIADSVSGSIALNQIESLRIKNWDSEKTDEDNSIIMQSTKGKIILIAAQQIIAKENLEVLAIGKNDDLCHGKPITSIINEVIDSERIPIVPWGFGKWTGRRGRIIEELIEVFKDRNHNVFLGDNGGRTSLLPRPKHFRHAKEYGFKILNGSDPLPFKEEQSKAGSYGFIINSNLDLNRPFHSIKDALVNQSLQVENYGRNEQCVKFCLNQVRMQVKKHL